MKLRESRWGIAVMLFLIAAVFFASVIWPPVGGEAAGGTRGDAVHEPASPAPGALADGGLQRETLEVPPAEDAPRSHLVEVKVRDEDGAPLAGAQVFVHRAGAAEGTPAHRARTGSGGVAPAVELPRGDYRLVVVRDGFFPSEMRPFSVPAEEPQRFEVTLRRGAVLRGQLFALDGKPVTHGLVRLRESGGETRLLKPDARGSFHSGALAPGAWTVAWIEHRHAEPSGAPPAPFTLAAGDDRKVVAHLEIEGREGADGRVPGILEVARR